MYSLYVNILIIKNNNKFYMCVCVCVFEYNLPNGQDPKSILHSTSCPA